MKTSLHTIIWIEEKHVLFSFLKIYLFIIIIFVLFFCYRGSWNFSLNF